MTAREKTRVKHGGSRAAAAASGGPRPSTASPVPRSARSSHHSGDWSLARSAIEHDETKAARLCVVARARPVGWCGGLVTVTDTGYTTTHTRPPARGDVTFPLCLRRDPRRSTCPNAEGHTRHVHVHRVVSPVRRREWLRARDENTALYVRIRFYRSGCYG